MGIQQDEPSADGISLGPLAILASISCAIVGTASTRMTSIAFNLAPGTLDTGTIHPATGSRRRRRGLRAVRRLMELRHGRAQAAERSRLVEDSTKQRYFIACGM